MNQTLSKATLALIGCGVIGSALLRGWLRHRDLFSKIIVVSPHRDKVLPFLEDDRVIWYTHPDQIEKSPDLILFAVKPQVLPSILVHYHRFSGTQTLFLTVVAALSLQFYEEQ